MDSAVVPATTLASLAMTRASVSGVSWANRVSAAFRMLGSPLMVPVPWPSLVSITCRIRSNTSSTHDPNRPSSVTSTMGIADERPVMSLYAAHTQ